MQQQQKSEAVDDDNAHMSDASLAAAAPSAPSAAAAAAGTGTGTGAASRASPRTTRLSPLALASAVAAAPSPPHGASPPTPLTQSARMREAQSFFQRVVKQELQVLLARGVEREVAVRKLLHRIVESTQAPEAADVRRVMKQFQMNYDDAVRALIVKQEIGRLKRQGMDAFAAIEELTRKMQRVLAADAAAPPASGGAAEEAAHARHRADRRARSDGSASDPTYSEGPDSASSPDADVELEEAEETHEHQVDAAAAAEDETGGGAATAAGGEPPAATSAAPTAVSPLSLCQRIDNVSISSDPSSEFVGVQSSATSAEQADASGGANASAPPAAAREAGLESPRSRSPTSSSSSPALVSRKRRAASSSVAAESKSGSHQPQLHHSHSHHHTGPSTFPLFPSAKKQKLMEVSDDYVAVVSRKYAKAPLSPSDSPVPATPTVSALKGSSITSSTSSSGGDVEVASGAAANPHKRRREVASRSPAVEHPVSDDDELAAAAHIVRLPKRHKSLSVKVAEVGAAGDDEHDVPASG